MMKRINSLPLNQCMIKTIKSILKLAAIVGAIVTIFAPISYIWFYFTPPELTNEQIIKLILTIGYFIAVTLLYLKIVQKQREEKDEEVR